MTRRGDKARKSRDVSRNTNGPGTVKARAPWRIGTLTRPLRGHRYGHNFSSGSSPAIGKEARELAPRQVEDLVEILHLHEVIDRQPRLRR